MVSEFWRARIPLKSNLFVLVGDELGRLQVARLGLDTRLAHQRIGNWGPSSLVLHLDGGLDVGTGNEVKWSSHECSS